MYILIQKEVYTWIYIISEVNKLVKKEIEFFEVEVKFLVRKGTPSADKKEELEQTVYQGIGGNDMNGIEAEDIKINIKE